MRFSITFICFLTFVSGAHADQQVQLQSQLCKEGLVHQSFMAVGYTEEGCVAFTDPGEYCMTQEAYSKRNIEKCGPGKTWSLSYRSFTKQGECFNQGGNVYCRSCRSIEVTEVCNPTF